MLVRRIWTNVGRHCFSPNFGQLGTTKKLSLQATNIVDHHHQQAKKLSLIPLEELTAFRNHFSQVVHQLTNLSELKTEKMLDEVNQRISTFLNYSVAIHGPLLRPQAVMAASNFFSKGKASKSGHRLHNLAWTVELVHTSHCLIDDVVDMADTRNGQVCWYRKDDMGLEAMNDGLLLQTLAIKFLDLNLAHDPTYPRLASMCDVVQSALLAGKSIFLTPGIRQTVKLTLDGYKDAVKLMHGYDAFYCPFALAMIWNDMDQPKLMEQMKNVTLDIGLLSAIQGHYGDSLGDEKLRGKIGSDIPNGRATWPFIVALNKANDSQRRELLENYGRQDQRNVDRVKALYVDIGVTQEYRNVVEESRHNLNAAIEALPATLPQETLQNIVNYLVE